MKAVAATLTSKGQVTIPAALRRALGLKPGDRLVFAQDDAGKFCLDARVATMADLRGIVRRPDGHPGETVDTARTVAWIEESRTARWQSLPGDET